ncbi:MAG: S41 family peptidase [Elusimicrobia bacterium]|nr:S41 family peptidase [Elusimicrobiota bacterium]
MRLAVPGAVPQPGALVQRPSGLFVPGEAAAEAPVDIPGLTEEQLLLMHSISAFVSERYIDPVEREKLLYAALRGMLGELDPHSQFFDPQEFKKFMEDSEGNFSGIGTVIRRKKPQQDGIFILGVFPESPAKKAGLKARDVIVRIDGKKLLGLGMEQASLLMKGPEGSEINLEIRRYNPKTKDHDTLSFTIKRGEVHTNNMMGKMLDGGKGYIYFDGWQPDTHVEFFRTVDRLKAEGMKELILDLRLNGGGDQRSMLPITASFLAAGETVFAIKNRQGQEQRFMSERDGPYKDMPVKILVNEYTASASEVFSACLQDYKRATIIGKQTYGKGVGQSVIPLNNGAGFKLTMMRWFTPLGRTIDGSAGPLGIVPDVVVSVPDVTDMRAVMRVRQQLNRLPAGRAVKDPILERALQP